MNKPNQPSKNNDESENTSALSAKSSASLATSTTAPTVTAKPPLRSAPATPTPSIVTKVPPTLATSFCLVGKGQGTPKSLLSRRPRNIQLPAPVQYLPTSLERYNTYQTFFPKNGKLSSKNEEIKIKAKNSPNMTSQDQALPTISPAPRQHFHARNPAKTTLPPISLAPSSQLPTYVRYLYPTFTNSRQQKPIEPSMCPNSLRLMTVRCDSVLIQDCELSQRESVSLRFSMPLDLPIVFKTRRRKLERRKSKSGPS